MATGFPLGSFMRGRRDWSIEQLMLGGCTTSGSSGHSRISLNNNSKQGNYLAVYGILAWRGYSVKTMVAFLSMVQDGLPAPTQQPYTNAVVPGNAAIDGYIGQANTAGGYGYSGLWFLADGSHWLTMGDTPLFVLPPGWLVAVQMINPNSNSVPAGEQFTASFLWGYYKSSKVPRIRRSASG